MSFGTLRPVQGTIPRAGKVPLIAFWGPDLPGTEGIGGLVGKSCRLRA